MRREMTMRRVAGRPHQGAIDEQKIRHG
jgi:hypothetical protein